MSIANAGPRPKHVPQRTCVGCGVSSAKRELVRFVRTPEGVVEPDPTGKRAGRGAYLCRNPECWRPAIMKGRLEHALKTKLNRDQRQSLVAYGTETLDTATT